MIIDGNDPEKLHNLMKYSHIKDDTDAYSVKMCAEQVLCPIQVIGATEDRIAGIEQVRCLANCIPTSTFALIESGHLAPFEDPSVWRTLVLDYLNS